MPGYITCTQQNCIYHTGLCTCSAEIVMVGSLGSGKYNTLCDRYLDKDHPPLPMSAEAQYSAGKSENPNAETGPPETGGVPILCAAQSCRFNSDAYCILIQPVYFKKLQGRHAPICSCYMR